MLEELIFLASGDFLSADNLHRRSSYYAVTQVPNKNSNIHVQGRSPNVAKVISMHKDLFLKERICSQREQILPLREVSIMKRDAIEEIHCLICVTFYTIDLCKQFGPSWI